MKKLICLISFMVVGSSIAQDKKAIKYASTIKSKDLFEHLEVLSSDKFEGRETGKRGQKLAAQYIADHFRKLELEAPVEGSYFQQYNLSQSSIATSYFRKGEERKISFEDFIYYSNAQTAGEEYINVIMADEMDSKIKSYKGHYVVYRVEALAGLQERINLAKEVGAKGCIAILQTDEFSLTLRKFGPLLKRTSIGLENFGKEGDKVIITNEELLSWIYEKEYDLIEPGDKSIVVFNADYLDKPIPTENVLGFLRGSEKPDEVIVITAHYDHLGITNGKINNGADDNGSGTSAVLELAEAFSKAASKKIGPKRSILFMTVSGEEKGKLGSQYYTDIDPIFPLENTVVNLNLDMIGRIDERHNGNPDYVYLIGSNRLSTELHDLSETMNKTYSNLELDYTYNDENDPNRFYYRSDHYNFAKNNVPIIFYFNGTHRDYHKPTDTIERINFEKIEKITKLVFYTAWEIANRGERIKLD